MVSPGNTDGSNSPQHPHVNPAAELVLSLCRVALIGLGLTTGFWALGAALLDLLSDQALIQLLWMTFLLLGLGTVARVVQYFLLKH